MRRHARTSTCSRSRWTRSRRGWARTRSSWGWPASESLLVAANRGTKFGRVLLTLHGRGRPRRRSGSGFARRASRSCTACAPRWWRSAGPAGGSGGSDRPERREAPVGARRRRAGPDPVGASEPRRAGALRRPARARAEWPRRRGRRRRRGRAARLPGGDEGRRPGRGPQVGGGLVADGRRRPRAVSGAFDRLVARAAAERDPGRGVLVEATASGVEVICGMRRDPAFGPVVLLGVGGTLTEVLHDVAVRVAPASPEDLEEMPDECAVGRCCDAAGGGPRRAAADVVAALARLALDHPEIAEVDVNPLFVGPRRARGRGRARRLEPTPRPWRREGEANMSEPIEACLRIRVGSEDAHYGTIAAGAFVMQLFGDLATEITVRRDGDEGLLRAYETRRVPGAGPARRLPGVPGDAGPRGPHVADVRGRGLEGDRRPGRTSAESAADVLEEPRPGGEGDRHHGGPAAPPADGLTRIPCPAIECNRPERTRVRRASRTFSKLPLVLDPADLDGRGRGHRGGAHRRDGLAPSRRPVRPARHPARPTRAGGSPASMPNMDVGRRSVRGADGGRLRRRRRRCPRDQARQPRRHPQGRGGRDLRGGRRADRSWAATIRSPTPTWAPWPTHVAPARAGAGALRRARGQRRRGLRA